jgi:hypothetical protein
MQNERASPLPELADWYTKACNGEWEHRYGISIQSTDNPGWWVQIDLAGTSLSKRGFRTVTQGMDADGNPTKTWIHCHVIDGVWHGAGDGARLQEIIERFLDWAGSEP